MNILFSRSYYEFQTGAIETQYYLKYHKLVSFSEQELVDCSEDNHGCNGGNYVIGFNFVKNNAGLDTEKAFPYTGVVGYILFHSCCKLFFS